MGTQNQKETTSSPSLRQKGSKNCGLLFYLIRVLGKELAAGDAQWDYDAMTMNKAEVVAGVEVNPGSCRGGEESRCSSGPWLAGPGLAGPRLWRKALPTPEGSRAGIGRELRKRPPARDGFHTLVTMAASNITFNYYHL